MSKSGIKLLLIQVSGGASFCSMIDAHVGSPVTSHAKLLSFPSLKGRSHLCCLTRGFTLKQKGL